MNMKRIFTILLITSCAVNLRAQEQFSPLDNLYLNAGAGLLVGDNGQPSSISNIAVAWDVNLGYWFGTSKYGGLRVGYMGDVLRSFNYSAKNAYGWNTIYIDGMLNASNLIYKTKTSRADPRWYCSPFISLECLVPMAQNSHNTAFGVGLGIANEINVHKNVSVTLDWRNTLAMVDGVKWLPEINAGLKFYFTGKARIEKTKKPTSSQSSTTIVIDCSKQNDSIKVLTKQLATLNERLAICESDTSVYHLEDKVIRDHVMYSCRLPYNYYSVNRAISIFPKIKDASMRDQYAENIIQLRSYYELSKELLGILSSRQNQLKSPTFNRSRWERGLLSELENFQKKDIYRLYYFNDVIVKVKKESKEDNPNFSEYIIELQEAIDTNPNK